jgi:hypothetical protein
MTAHSIGSTGFVVSMPSLGIAADPSEQIIAEALSILRGAKSIYRRPKSVNRALNADHSDGYIQQLLSGVRPLSLDRFIRLLFIVERETVRRIFQVIVRPFGLDVVPSGDRPTKDVKSEIIEAAGACGRAFAAVDRAVADGIVTAEERSELEAELQNAKVQLDDVLKVLR